MFVLDNGKRFVIPRTELTYPGHNMKLHQNAADPVKAPVDHVMADFEDACPYEFKGEKSRKVMVEALNTLDFGKKVVTIRPNNIHSQLLQGRHGSGDAGRAQPFPRASSCPRRAAPRKSRLSRSCSTTSKSAADGNTSVQIESLIETPHALIKAYDIATASDRMAGLIFGIADFAANLGIREIVEDQNRNFHYSKQAVVIAAKAAGLHAIDNVFLRLMRKDDPPERIAEMQTRLREKNDGAAEPRHGRNLGDSSAAGRDRQRLLLADAGAGQRGAPGREALPREGRRLDGRSADRRHDRRGDHQNRADGPGQGRADGHGQRGRTDRMVGAAATSPATTSWSSCAAPPK